MPNALNSIIAVVMLFIASMMGLAVVDGITSATGQADNGERVQVAQQLDGTNFVAINQIGAGRNETVRNSRGKALAFDGSTDASIQSDADISIHERENWTVAQAVLEINASDTDENMTIVTEGDPQIYLRYAGNRSVAKWQVIYHANDLRDSYLAEVNATDPTNRTHVFAQRDAATLYIFENDTTTSRVGTAAIDGSDDDIPTLTTDQNLNGTLDETRMIGTNLSASQRSQLVSAPNDGLAGVNHSARLTYDEYVENKGEVRVWWTPASATLGTGVGFVDGLDGEVLERKTVLNDIAGTSDYGWGGDGPKIRAVSGGQLDGSPVAYVEYNYVAATASVLQGFGDMISIVSLVGVVVVAGLIVARIKTLT